MTARRFLLREWLMTIRTLLMTLFYFGSTACCFGEEISVDVCVYGGTPAGVAAAVAAAREGSHVALIEPENILGGMMSSGLSFSDSNQMAREALGGIFEEFYQRVAAHYRDEGTKLTYDYTVKDNRPWVNEPHVAEKIFHELIRESGVKLYLGHGLKSLEKQGNRIQRLTADETSFRAKVFIDASYEGDLLPAAGVSFVVGREPAARYRESLAGPTYPKTPLTVSPFDADGSLLPLMTAPTAGDPTQFDRHVMAYSFRLCVTDVPENQIPFPQPENYDPAQFELVRRYLKQYPKAGQLMDFYPLPNRKWDVNNSIGGQISLGLLGASDAWPGSNSADRKIIWKRFQNYTLGLIHFLRTDPVVPARLRSDIQRWGLCRDEFVDNGHWPPILYIREARRMQGVYLLKQNDILTEVRKADSIGVVSFPIDSHDCQRLPTADGGIVNEGTIFPRHIPGRKIGQPYEVPYRCITPLASECENLLTPVCLSSTHVAMCSIRVEPAWIVIGQSSGIAAHLAAAGNHPVQAVDYPQLRQRLLAQKQIVDLDKVELP
jgi:hypothetical protein